MVDTFAVDHTPAAATLSIGAFAQLTHLTRRALRHYHETGVLVPSSVDPATGYRRYTTEQVSSAHLVRRLRAIDMPLPAVREILAAPDADHRDRLIAQNLQQMEAALVRSQLAVASLRELLEDRDPDVEILVVDLPPTPAFAVREQVARADLEAWCPDAFDRLYRSVVAAGTAPTGAGGGLYGGTFFEDGGGEVLAFVPAPIPLDGVDCGTADGVETYVLPASRYAVAVHAGPFDDLDRTYGALGTHVSTRGLAAPGPIREHYLVSPADSDDPAELRTEVCWPVRRDPGGPTP